MQRPIDAVTSAALKLQMAQQAVNLFIEDLIQRVSADPLRDTSLPDMRVRLSELRSEVDEAAAELIDAMARMGEASADLGREARPPR